MDAQGVDDILLHPEFQEIETTEHRSVLVLPTTSNTKVKTLRLISEFGQFVQVPFILAKLVEAAKDGGGYHGRPSKTRIHWEVGMQIEFKAKIGLNGLKQCLNKSEAVFLFQHRREIVGTQ